METRRRVGKAAGYSSWLRRERESERGVKGVVALTNKRGRIDKAQSVSNYALRCTTTIPRCSNHDGTFVVAADGVKENCCYCC